MIEAVNSAAREWLESMGYAQHSLSTPMDGHIRRWRGYIDREASFYIRRETDQDGKPVDIPLRSCTPAAMVCADMAGLLYNEKASVSVPADEAANQFLQEWLTSCAWHDNAPLAIESMCATGTGAWALHLDGVADAGVSQGLRVRPIWYDANEIVPLAWDASGCSACAFFSPVWNGGKDCTQVEVHRPTAEGYEIASAVFDEDGRQVALDGTVEPGQAVRTRQPLPTFSIVRLARPNRYWPRSPMGVSLFDDALDAIQTVDLAFDALGNEIVLGRKMLALPESMMRKDERTGRLMLPQLSGQQFFLATKANTYDDKLGVYEYNPQLRASENRQLLDTALQMLGKRVGFGTKAYSLDSQGGITTAKQVASDNAEMMRTVRKHEHTIRPAIEPLMNAVLAIYRSLGGVPLPADTPLAAAQVQMGDSIMQDTDSMRDSDRADVAAGLLEPWRYMVRWQGYTEEEAKEASGASAEPLLPME